MGAPILQACNTLQQTAAHCNTLQHTAIHCNTLQHAATHYSILQHKTSQTSTWRRSSPPNGRPQFLAGLQHTQCNTLQHTATHCNMLQQKEEQQPNRMNRSSPRGSSASITTHCRTTHYNALQRTATHYNTLQHTATHYNTLQHTATHYDTLRHTATYCNTLQHTANVRMGASYRHVTRLVHVRHNSFSTSIHSLLFFLCGRTPDLMHERTSYSNSEKAEKAPCLMIPRFEIKKAGFRVHSFKSCRFAHLKKCIENNEISQDSPLT